MTKKEILIQKESLRRLQNKRIKLFLKYFLDFMNKLKDLKRNKYYLVANDVPMTIYERVIYPYFLKIIKKQHLLFRIYYNCFGKVYLKNIDTPLYRKQIYLYFMYLTQGKGIKPPTFFDITSARKLSRDIYSLCFNYGFIIDIKRYYDIYYNLYKYKICVY